MVLIVFWYAIFYRHAPFVLQIVVLAASGVGASTEHKSVVSWTKKFLFHAYQECVIIEEEPPTPCFATVIAVATQTLRVKHAAKFRLLPVYSFNCNVQFLVVQLRTSIL